MKIELAPKWSSLWDDYDPEDKEVAESLRIARNEGGSHWQIAFNAVIRHEQKHLATAMTGVDMANAVLEQVESRKYSKKEVPKQDAKLAELKAQYEYKKITNAPENSY